MTPERIHTKLIDADPGQPRQEIDSEGVKQLAKSIRDLGQLQPVIVHRHGQRFRLIDGHRRHAAITLLGRPETNALVLNEAPDADTLLLTQLAANCMREDLKPTEKAQAYQRLKDSRGWTNVQLADSLHVSKSTVTLTLSYLSLPKELQAKLDIGELAGSTAYAIARAKDGATRQALIAKATKNGLTRDAAQQNVARSTNHKTYRSSFQLDAATVTVSSHKQLELTELIGVWKQLGRECRKADSQGLDTATLEQVLTSQRRAAK